MSVCAACVFRISALSFVHIRYMTRVSLFEAVLSCEAVYGRVGTSGQRIFIFVIFISTHVHSVFVSIGRESLLETDDLIREATARASEWAKHS